jgi:hypothetical protein
MTGSRASPQKGNRLDEFPRKREIVTGRIPVNDELIRSDQTEGVRVMSNDITKKDDPTAIDNFAGWTDEVEGHDQPQNAGIIQGNLIKFTNEAQWVLRDGNELSANLELIVVDVARIVQKWWDQQPVETIILEPHQKFPDIEEMNEKVPRKEWIEGPDGKPRGPWQAQHVVYLLDPNPMDKYTFPTGTTGGRIAVGDLRDKIILRRRLQGPNVYPVVRLSDTFFPTRYGGRQRPSFKIERWVRLGGEGGEVQALSPPTPPITTKEADLPLQEVKEPNDAVPDLGKAESPKASAPPLPNPRRNLKKPARDNARKAKRRPANVLDVG